MTEVARVYPLKRQQPEAQVSEPQLPEPQLPEPLWREVLGSRLRALRVEREETLKETAERAGVSPQYLSEIERGRKEPSSEMIAALAGALGITLIDLTIAIAEDIRRSQAFHAERAARLDRTTRLHRGTRLDRTTRLDRGTLAGRPGSAPNALALVA